MIKLASYDYIDLKPYEADMRYILDTYIRAEDSQVISELGNMSIIELLLEKTTTTSIETLIKDLPGDEKARAEIIDNNLQYEIVKKMSSNEVYYGKLSEMLKNIINQRLIEAISYEEYLRQVVELAQAILHPEESSYYPDTIKKRESLRALYDFFDRNEVVAIGIDKEFRKSIRPGWRDNQQKQQNIKLAIYQFLLKIGWEENDALQKTITVFELMKRQVEFNE
jgi:type I restriction enzyme R subunit